MTRAGKRTSGYLVDILITLERHGASVIFDLAEPAWIRSDDGSISGGVHATLPANHREGRLASAAGGWVAMDGFTPDCRMLHCLES